MKTKISISILLAIMFVGCRATRTVSERNISDYSSQIDSINTVITHTVKPVVIDRDVAQLTLTQDKIKELPTDASYIASSGRANAILTRVEDQYLFTADCDSVSLMLEHTQVLMLRYKKLAETKSITTVENISHETSGWQWFQIYGFRILLLINLLLIIFKRLKIWQKIFY